MQKRLEMPPTPSSSPSPPPPQKHIEDYGTNVNVQIIPTVFVADQPSSKNRYIFCPQSLCGKSDKSGVLDPQGTHS